jgi:hypothetical protein
MCRSYRKCCHLTFARLARVHPPQREIEEGGEGNPRQVWHQDPTCGFADTQKGDQREQNRDPQRDDDNESPADFPGTEEDRSPCRKYLVCHFIVTL